MSEAMYLALQLLGQGMAGIFVVLGVIALTVAAMQKFSREKGEK